MTLVLDPHSHLKYKAGLVILFAIGMMASIGTLIHSVQPNAHPIDKIVPPLLAIGCATLFVYLYRHRERHDKLSSTIPILMALPIVIPTWVFTLEAFASPSTTLIDRYPPLTTPFFLWTTVTLIFIKPQHLVKFVCVGWFVGATPVLVYLFLHPAELRALRGLDLLISFGPATIVQSATIVFYSRLQVLLDKLYAERLQYYSKVIEEQAIRASAMEEAFTQFHNGPLQSLAVLLRDVRGDCVPSPEVIQRLAQLNTEIRDVGQSLIASTQMEESIANPSPKAIGRSRLRLGSGTLLDLNLPLDRLLHEVYTVTLKRNLPHFQTIRAKIRNFDRLDNVTISFDLKRELCLWLEESLCNVGKHAQGVTRIQVTGTCENGRYTLTVRDNGVGLQPGREQQGTKQSQRLAQRLGGTFRREPLPKGGVVCELAWSVESGMSSP